MKPLEHPVRGDKSVSEATEAKELRRFVHGIRANAGTTAAHQLLASGLTSDSPLCPGPTDSGWPQLPAAGTSVFDSGGVYLRHCYENRGAISGWQSYQQRDHPVAQKLLLAAFLAHLMVMPTRSSPDLLITSSDTCAARAEIAATAGLYAYGVASALANTIKAFGTS